MGQKRRREQDGGDCNKLFHEFLQYSVVIKA
jgi:hypothetical protein